MTLIEINGMFEVRAANGVVLTRVATIEEANAYLANPPVTAPATATRPLPPAAVKKG